MSVENRKGARQAVLKVAKLEWDNSLVDCIIKEQSATGVRVGLMIPMTVPAQVTVHMRGGAVRTATQRWARGTEIGFEFTGLAKLDAVAAGDALAILADLAKLGLDGIVARLAAARYFDDSELCATTLAAQAAVQRLETALRKRAEGDRH